MSATIVLTNGHIYTMDPRKTKTTAIAIRDNRIVALGSDAEVESLRGAGSQKINLNGRCVIPGLVDAHVHFQGFSLNLQRIDMYEVPSLDEALSRLRAYAPQLASGQWLRGHGWTQELWPDRAFPTAAQLDSAVPHLPVCLTHKSAHAAWANSMALRLAGIDDHTPDPPGGHIQRDERGKATGMLFEDAMNLVSEHIPRATAEELTTAMRRAQEICWQAGLTGLHDFDGRDCFKALQTLHQNGELGLRIVKNIPVYRLEHAIGVGLRSGFGDDWLRIGGVKMFADGALGPRTASMIAPYEGEADNYGIVVTDKEEMMAKASQASANGISVTVHAIGDRANHDILDVYQAVRQQEAEGGDGSILRHRIEHVQLLHPDDLGRLSQLKVIASMQPTHATSDMEMADHNWGPRAQYGYAWRTLLDTGATLVFGSDSPIESIAPLPGIHAAVTRRRADGTPGPDGWYPEQKLTVTEAVHAFTTAAAITSGQETTLGSLEAGKLADLTIFERDIFTSSPDELLEIPIAGTMVGGRFMHRTW